MEDFSFSNFSFWDLNQKIHEKREPRMDPYLMYQSPWPTVAICMAYFYISLYWGPRFMKDQKPYNIKYFLLLYNIIQVILNVWMVIKTTPYIFKSKLVCEPILNTKENADDTYLDIMVWAASMFYHVKLLDLVDTMAFVVTKKFSHITFLHVFHHGSLPMCVWSCTKFYLGGHGAFFPYINSIVHIVMYSYYFLSALGPWIQPYLWWKRYLTQLQMIQFVFAFFQNVAVYMAKDCNYPISIIHLNSFLALAFLILFANFYIQSYLKKMNKKAD